MALCGHSEDPNLTRIPEAAGASKCGPLVSTFSLLLASIFIGNNRVFRKKIHSKENRMKTNLDTQKTPKGTRQAKLNL